MPVPARPRRHRTGPALVATVLALSALALAPAAHAAPAVSSPNCGAVEYGGAGSPSGVIVSDLPMVGGSAERSVQMVAAIRIALANAGWKAGNTAVGFQVCNDALQSTGAWDAATCTANANAYARTPGVLGVVGTYNSGCAALIIPILNQAGIAMVSPGNTAVCLTQSVPGCTGGQPASLYPDGARNYARVVPNDAYQGAGLAEFARAHHIRRPAILYAGDDPTSLGQARAFRGAAKALHAKVVAFRAWDQKAKGYRTLMRRIARKRPDAVLLAGLIEENGARIVKDKVAVLGRNTGHVALLAPDGFAQQSTIDRAGKASAGMFVSLPGRDPGRLTGAGKTLVQQLAEQVSPNPIELFAPYAAQATDVLLAAIAKGTTAQGTTSALLGVQVQGGILGSFGFTASGDPTVAPISVYRAARTLRFAAEERPSTRLVDAARKG
ncbi:MAG TPA: branched-chain amino acid ABC transporter substrate-binding protein [Solirubrobacteraceae bacterium]|nr:branched-chain amino acid ABC transporter substrate-binding protein [Solirubrobacteraceae bacterium]